VHTRTELCEVAALAAETGTTVIVDEIHAPLTEKAAQFVPYLSLPGSESAILVTSASKAYNLAAVKAALVIPGGVAHAKTRFAEHVRYGASYFGVLAHVAALDHGDPWLGDVLTNITSNRLFLQSELERQGVPATSTPGEATYLCWVDGRRLGLGSDPAAVLRTSGRVAFNSGSPFGAGGDGYFRVNVAASKELLTEAVRRIRDTIAGLHAPGLDMST
jgi:cystathionine beta-lyase